MPIKKPKAKTTKEEGVAIVSSSGNVFTPSEVTADVIKDLLDNNNWCAGLVQKQKNLIYTDKFSLEVLDAKGEADPGLAKTMTNMCENVRMWAMMQLGYADGEFGYGIGVYNPIWGYEGSEYRLQDLRYLPAYTFRNAGGNQMQTYSELLPGITLSENKKEVEFYQTDDSNETHKLNTANLFWIKDPSSANLAGKSIFKPIVPIIELLKYAWATETQHMNRVGAPIIFIKITNPQPASARLDGVSDVEYAGLFLKQWGKDSAFILRENMEKFELNIKDNANNLEVIRALNAMIIDYMSPTSFISSGEGKSLGDSSKSRETFFYKYIKGIHTGLEDQWERLLQMYLDKNGYEGYIVNMHIPTPDIDHSEIELQQAKVGRESQSLSVNERRKRLGAEPLDEAGLKKLEDEFARAMTPVSPGFESEASISTKVPRDPILERALHKASIELSKDITKALDLEEGI